MIYATCFSYWELDGSMLFFTMCIHPDVANLVWYCAGNPRFQCQKGETPSMHGAYSSTLPGCIKQRISISAFIIMSVFVIFGLWQ